MGSPDYSAEAVLYWAKNEKGKPKSLVIKRFPRVAEAVLYAIEELPVKALAGCSIETDDMRYFGREIRPLYDNADFPLTRQVALKG